jgi:hypothetical protein
MLDAASHCGTAPPPECDVKVLSTRINDDRQMRG